MNFSALLRRRFLSPFVGVGLLPLSAALHAAPATPDAEIDRQLSVTLSVEAQQTWKADPEGSRGSTSQSYQFVTVLRSDGRLEAVNYLDPDLNRRMRIKLAYMKREGMAGTQKAPVTLAEKQALASQLLTEKLACKGDILCTSKVNRKFAAILATADSGDGGAPEAPDDILEGEGRYLIFFPFDGCPSRIVSKYTARVEGIIARDRERKKLRPFVLQRDADSAGSALDQRALCSHYTATIDTREQKMYWDNLYIPAAIGVAVLKDGEVTQRSEQEFPVPSPVMDWVFKTLRYAPLSGSASATLPLPEPIDGDWGVPGKIDGSVKVNLKWAFTETGATK